MTGDGFDVINHCDVEVALGHWDEHEGHCEFGNGISATCTCGCDLCGAPAGEPCEAPCPNVIR